MPPGDTMPGLDRYFGVWRGTEPQARPTKARTLVPCLPRVKSARAGPIEFIDGRVRAVR